MPVATVAEFVEALRQSQLVEPARLSELDDEMYRGGAGPVALADALVRWGWVTRFQADCLLEGRGRELTVGPYMLLARLGKGGMGEVFQARQQRLDRVVALKVIRTDQLKYPDAVKRFQFEARAAAQLKHPNVVTIYDADEAEDAVFIVMEYVEGTDLARLVKRDGPLPVDVVVRIARQMADALVESHHRRMVHRDIKPGNIRLTPDGQTKLLDFGLARWSGDLDEPGKPLGTVAYMAPEQVHHAEKVDIRADLYGLGGTLHWCLTGKSPFPVHGMDAA